MADYLIGHGYSYGEVTKDMTLGSLQMAFGMAQQREKSMLLTDFSSRLLAARGDEKGVKKFQQDLSNN